MKIRVFFILILFSFKVISQTNNYLEFNPEKSYSQQFIDSMITTSKRIDIGVLKKILETNSEFKGWVKYYQGKASTASKMAQIDSVIYYSNKAIEAYNDSELKRPIDEKVLVAVYNLRGYAYRKNKDYKSAMNNYQAALDLENKYPYKWKSYILTGIALSHYSLGNDSIALAYYQKAVKDSNYLSVTRAAVSTFSRIGLIYDNLGQEELAIKYYKNTLEYSYNKKHYNNVAALNGMIGSIKYEQDSIQETLKYFKRAASAYEEFGPGHYSGEDEDQLLFSGFINVHQGNVLKGINDLKKLINRFMSYEKINKFDKTSIILSYETLSEAYRRLNDVEALAKLNKDSRKLLEDYYTAQREEGLINLELKYQTKEKDASIAQLEKNEAQQQTIIKQQRYLTFGLAGLLLLLSGFGYLFWKQRKLKNQYEKENLEQRLLRSQMNPHFIGNAMNTISALVERKSEETIPFINKLSNLFRLMLTNSREEFVSLGEELMIIRSYLELQSNFSNRFEFNISTDQNEDLEEILVPPMLIQPLVENAIIHGLSNKNEDGEITVHVEKDIKENLLKVTVNDNGNGFDKSMLLNPNQNKKSISGNIVKERIEILKKKFKVNTRLTTNSSSKGTKVELYLPYIVDV